MMKPKLRHLPLAAAALVTCMGAQAGYTSPDGDFSLSGFGTLGIAKTSTKDAFYNYPGQGVGVMTTPGITPDSKIAAQGTYKFAPTFSATAQVMSKANAYGDYAPDLEWAFAKWQAAPSLAIRVGRMGVPYFAISDFREVNYANQWVRPPLDVYGQVPVSQFEGLDASYQATFGPLTLTSTVWAGDSHAKYSLADPKLYPPSDVDIKHQIGINFQGEVDNGVTFRFGRARGKLSVKSATGLALQTGATNVNAASSCIHAYGVGAYAACHLPSAVAGGAFGALYSAQSAFNDTIDLLNVNGKDATFTGLGLGYDSGNLVTSLEYTKRKTDSYVSDSTGWYASVGYRFGKFTPYLGYSKLKTDRTDDNPLAKNATVTAIATALKAAGSSSVQDLIDGMQRTLNTQLDDEKTSTVGVRWDVSTGLAVKAQWDRVHKSANSQGLFFSPDPNSNFVSAGRKVDVLSVSVDFVF